MFLRDQRGDELGLRWLVPLAALTPPTCFSCNLKSRYLPTVIKKWFYCNSSSCGAPPITCLGGVFGCTVDIFPCIFWLVLCIRTAGGSLLFMHDSQLRRVNLIAPEISDPSLISRPRATGYLFFVFLCYRTTKGIHTLLHYSRERGQKLLRRMDSPVCTCKFPDRWNSRLEFLRWTLQVLSVCQWQIQCDP